MTEKEFNDVGVGRIYFHGYCFVLQGVIETIILGNLEESTKPSVLHGVCV